MMGTWTQSCRGVSRSVLKNVRRFMPTISVRRAKQLAWFYRNVVSTVMFKIGQFGWLYSTWMMLYLVLYKAARPETTASEYLLNYGMYISLWFVILYVYLQLIHYSDDYVPPKQFHLDFEQHDHVMSLKDDVTERNRYLSAIIRERELPIYTLGPSKQIRYCQFCRAIMPDRCLHSMMSGKCLLRYDHWCPWICRDVSQGSHKQFIMFCLYGAVYSYFCFGHIHDAAARSYYEKEWHKQYSLGIRDNHHLYIGWMGGMTFAGVQAIMGSFHLFLTLVNMTTFEFWKGSITPSGKRWFFWWQRSIYDNFAQLFGHNWRRWPLSEYAAAVNGWDFPVKTAMRRVSSYAMEI